MFWREGQDTTRLAVLSIIIRGGEPGCGDLGRKKNGIEKLTNCMSRKLFLMA